MPNKEKKEKPTYVWKKKESQQGKEAVSLAILAKEPTESLPNVAITQEAHDNKDIKKTNTSGSFAAIKASLGGLTLVPLQEMKHQPEPEFEEPDSPGTTLMQRVDRREQGLGDLISDFVGGDDQQPVSPPFGRGCA